MLIYRGKDLRERPLKERRAVLESKIMSLLSDPIRLSAIMVADPRELTELVRSNGFEGKKLAGQAEVLERIPKSAEWMLRVRAARARLNQARSIDELRYMEAEGASAYWQAWSDLPVKFPSRDTNRIPQHWRTFGDRSSPISSPSPRRAGNPANAMLNYLYAILEAEARIALLTAGLDPGIGLLHADTRARDSLACDLMEVVRPSVDEFVLEMILDRVFKLKQFFETREGVCRILPPLSVELAQTAPIWRKAIARPVENVAQRLLQSVSKKTSEEQYPDETAVAGGHKESLSPVSDLEASGSAKVMRIRLVTTTHKPSSAAKNPGLPWHAPKTPRLPCLTCGAEIDGNHRSYCEFCRSE